jgi:hypothetical protein
VFLNSRSNPAPTELILTAIGTVKATASGNQHLPCDTTNGKVAFWGTRANRKNIDLILGMTPPIRLRCDCIPSNWSQHALWIPESASIVRISSGPEPHRPVGPPPQQVVVTTADDLALWRRRLLRLVDLLENDEVSTDGLVGRITRLKRDGRIPRETAALMIALTELRNVAEHQGKQPSAAEGIVARNAWLAICEWANTLGIRPEGL